MDLNLKLKIRISLLIVVVFTFGINISIVYFGVVHTSLSGFEGKMGLIGLFGAGFAIATSVVLIIASILTKIIVKPLDNLKASVQEMSVADFSTQIKTTHNDEFGFLNEVFGIMAEKFQKLYINMDEQVTDKATILSRQMDEIKKSKSAI